MERDMKYLKLLLVLAFASIAGCATFPGNVLPEVTSFPVATNKPSVNVTLSFRQNTNGQPNNNGEKAGELKLQKMVIERFEKSGLYSSVSAVNQNSDFTVTTSVIDEGNGPIGLAFLSGFTFCLIPSYATDIFKATAVVKNNKTGVKKTIELEDSTTMWIQIFLLPLLPFKFPPAVISDVQNNIMDTLAIRVYEITKNSSTILPVLSAPIPVGKLQ